MAEYTEYYNLKKPTQDENYNVDVANKNNDIIDSALQSKQEKIPGKSLSSNDFTNEYKSKIQSINESNNKLIEKSNKLEQSVRTNSDSIQAVNEDLKTKSDKASTATDLDVSLNQEDYKLKIFLKNNDGQILSEKEVDFPIESMIVNATYNKETKEIEMTLQNENKIKFGIEDLISGLISQTDLDTALENLKTEIERELIENVNSEINTNYKEKTEAFNQNVSDKTTEFNTNADLKEKDFNSNVQQKTNEFNQNAESYKNDIDSLKQECNELSKNMSFNTVEGEIIDIDDAHEYSKNSLKVSGNDYQETREGYNQLNLEDRSFTSSDIDTEIKDGQITLNGIPSNVNFNEKICTFTANEEGTYTLLPFKSSVNNNIRLLYKINSGNFINSDSNSKMELKANDVLDIHLRIDSTNNIANFILKPILYEGTENKQYEQFGAMPSPKFASPIQTVKENIHFYKCGKNQFNFNKIQTVNTVSKNENGSFISNNNVILIGVNFESVPFSGLKLNKDNYYLQFKIKANSNVTLNNLFICTRNKENVANNIGKSINKELKANTETIIETKFELTEFKEKIGIVAYLSSSIDFTVYDMMICKDIDDTKFEEYNENNYTLAVQKEMFEEDYFTKDEEVHKWKEIVLTGNEPGFSMAEWETSLTKVYSFRMHLGSILTKGTKICSNYFEEKEILFNKDFSGMKCAENASIDFHIQKELLTDGTIQSFKTWLKQKYDEGNPVTIYYKSSEEERLQLTEEQKAVITELYDNFELTEGANHIYSDDEVSPIFILNYMQSNKILNQKRDEKIKNIESRLSLLE